MKRFLHDVITGQECGTGAWILKPVLWLLSLVYLFGVSVIRVAYFSGVFKRVLLGRPVISVGNITVGGTGKTPFVIFLAERFRSSGVKPSILMRGYMSRSGAASDEAEMVRRCLEEVPVSVSSDRVRAGEESLRRHRPDVFILDDGFQHWKLRRDLDIVLIDAVNPFGGGGLLPLGTLREPRSQLARADLFVITRSDLAPDRIAGLRAELARTNPRAGIVETAHVPAGIEEPFALGGAIFSRDFTLIKGRVAAFSAIGSPIGFEATLKGLGAEVAHHEAFIDHHVYTVEDVRKVADFCRASGLDRVVTTQKDLVKILQFRELFKNIRLFVLSVTVRVLKGENEISSRLDRLLHS